MEHVSEIVHEKVLCSLLLPASIPLFVLTGLHKGATLLQVVSIAKKGVNQGLIWVNDLPVLASVV